jgi:hypothetical protein
MTLVSCSPQFVVLLVGSSSATSPDLRSIIMSRMFLSSSVLVPPARRMNSIMLSSVVNRALRGSGVRFRSLFQKTTNQQPFFSPNDISQEHQARSVERMEQFVAARQLEELMARRETTSVMIQSEKMGSRYSFRYSAQIVKPHLWGYLFEKYWRRGSGSNRRIKVLQFSTPQLNP